jgi:hypothetical protein
VVASVDAFLYFCDAQTAAAINNDEWLVKEADST